MQKSLKDKNGNPIAHRLTGSPFSYLVTADIFIRNNHNIFSIAGREGIMWKRQIGICGGGENEIEKSYAGSNRYRQIS